MLGATGLAEHGLRLCRRAVELAPDFGNARNEIGIILSNMRRHKEARTAFLDAEPYHGEHAHHWWCRANNCIALGKYEEAEGSFRKAIDLTGNEAHMPAKAQLAAILMKNGKTREARALGKRVAHVMGQDPTEDVEVFLDIWNSRNPLHGTGLHM